MAQQRTLAIIKPDAFAAKACGRIIDKIEKAGFEIIAAKVLRLSLPRAEGFYAVHKGKPFYENLTEFMTEGRIMVLVLEHENAIALWRQTMGATDPSKAETGSIRREFGTNVGRNACHGSDSPENAKLEVEYFFTPEELGRQGA